jgi:hypothetical protein
MDLPVRETLVSCGPRNRWFPGSLMIPNRRALSYCAGPCLLALVLTLLNSLKPLHIDDSTYYAYARQIAKHPLDPYGFALLYFETPLPANHVLAPPVLPYWWAAGIRLFGDQPVLWKVWLLPFFLALTFSLYALGRRFAPSFETPIAWQIALSPAVLPGINLMTDVPAEALSLAALALFLQATRRDSVSLALVSGLVAGLAVETKYTGLVVLGVTLAYAVLFHRMRFWWPAAAAAMLLVVSWEAWIATRYGESHFLYHVWVHTSGRVPRLQLFFALLTLLGATAPVVMLLALAALRWSGIRILLTAVGVLLTYALVAVGGDPQGGSDRVSLPWLDLVFGALGVAFLWSAWAILRKVLRRVREASSPDLAARHDGEFLVVWLLLELVAYFALTPFPAVRRIMGIVGAMSFLAGHVAAQTCAYPGRRVLVWSIAGFGVISGVIFFTVDCRDAVVEREAAEAAARWIRTQQPDAVIWYVGYWGFQFYTERAGFRQVIPWYDGAKEAVGMPSPSVMHRGDWLVAPGAGIPQQHLGLDASTVDVVKRLEITDRLPLKATPGYYNGKMAMEHLAGPRMEVVIARLKRDIIAARSGVMPPSAHEQPTK